MRKNLKKINNKRVLFYATFERYGEKPAYRGYPIVTLLFKDIKDATGNVIENHIWFTTNKSWEQFGFNEGDQVSFEARVKAYEKGYKGHRDDVYNPIRTDYKLSHPTKIRRITSPIPPLAIPFGGDIPELGFSVEEWNKSYGTNRPEGTKIAEQLSLQRTNEARAKNGLSPI